MSDLAIVDPSAALDAAADPAEFVVVALERGKSWLAEALAHGDLEALVNMKGWAATLRTATMQKQLGKDAELAATELVRRAERCIGLGIRAGQQRGEVLDRSLNGQVRQGVVDKTLVNSPRDYATASELSGNDRTGIYAMTDDVTDDQFEQAIADAKTECNLSRANLVRHAKGTKAKPKPADRHEIHRRAPRVHPERIIEETINTLEGLAMGLALIEPAHYRAIDAEKRLEWLNALHQPLAAITRMKKGLSG